MNIYLSKKDRQVLSIAVVKMIIHLEQYPGGDTEFIKDQIESLRSFERKLMGFKQIKKRQDKKQTTIFEYLDKQAVET